MAKSIKAGVARLSLVDHDSDGGVRLPRPATPRSFGSTHQEAERSCHPSTASPVAARLMSRQDLALAALSQTNNADNHAARQAVADNRFFARDGTRLNPGWTIQDSNLECKHTGPWRDLRGQRVSPLEPVHYKNIFREEGVILCEDGRSGARCRVWSPCVLHCHKCDTYMCKQCSEEQHRPDVNAKHRLKPAKQRRDAKRGHKRETYNLIQKFSSQKLL